jgi:lysyl-tRNA synthetase, class I
MADNRVDPKILRAGDSYWTDSIARQVLTTFPNEDIYTCAAGISPSGVVHFGNFRDVITSVAVALSLTRAGKKTRVIFSWDNFDRFRKVPAGIPESWSTHIGKPLTSVPDPFPCAHGSYAEHFQEDFERAMKDLGISLEYRNQTKEYQRGVYDGALVHALNHRTEIADILLSFMTEKAKGDKGVNPDEYRENYYPVSVYSRFSGKDSTKVLAFDGVSKLTYRCIETGKEETIDIFTDHIVKLAWKIDWPMRWKHEGVVFEPGGHDHASPGGSYDTSTAVVEKVFSREAPVFAEYKFVGIQGLGAKMSGSKGNVISPAELLEIYEPVLLKWLYFRKAPDQPFSLAFDSDIFRQYDEFDRICSGSDALTALERRALDDARDAVVLRENPLPFRQAVGYGQIIQWDEEKLTQLLAGLGISHDVQSIRSRLPRAKTWLETYNESEMITLFDSVHAAYAATLTEATRGHVMLLRKFLSNTQASIGEIETLVYDIPKSPTASEDENKKLQREFFKHVYQLLIGKDTGPRLSTFLWAVPRDKVLSLLSL